MKYVSLSEFKKSKHKASLGVRKDFAAQAEVISDRTLKFTISTSTPDRSYDVIDQNGWQLDFYKMNPVVLWDHSSDRLPIGKCVEIGIEGGALKATVEFIAQDVPVAGPFAEAILQLCKHGFLSATSVGFLPIDYTETEDESRGAGTYSAGLDFHKMQLLEFSVVCTPDNPEALIDEQSRQAAISADAAQVAVLDDGKLAEKQPEKNSKINNINRERRGRDLKLRENFSR